MSREGAIASPVNWLQWQKGKVSGDRHRVAEREFVAAEALSRQAGDPWGLAAGKGNYAVIPGCKGELGQALALVEKAKALWKNLGDKSNWERLLINKGRVLAKLGQPGRTTACLRRAGKLLRRGREWPALAVSLTTVASFYSKQGKNRLAGKAFDRARSRAGRIREARFAWPAFMAIKRPGCWESDCWPRLRLLPKRPSCPASAAG